MSHAIELPQDFIDETFIGGLDGQITGFDLRVPGKVFLSEKAGIVRVVADGQLQAEPFLDISDIVNDRVDRGMLSVAVHPQFPQSPYIYVLYTYDPPELVTNNLTGAGVQNGNGNRVSRLARYTADESRDFNVAIAGSERIILGTNSTFDAIGNAQEQFDTDTPSCGPVGNPTVDCMPSDEITHTIGALRFADDGSLYVTNGDGSSYRTREEWSQMTYDLNSMRGKIMRIDPDTGLGLPDNPFYDGDPASNRSRVVSYGLRNPYSLALNPVTGVPYVGDVGQETWEEVNGGSGVNFGWPCYEGGPDGNLRQELFQLETYCEEFYQLNEPIERPLTSWVHGGTGNAVVLGDFYFGEQFPAQYMGKLFFGDYIQGELRYADISDPQNVIVEDFATDMLPMVEMRTGGDGALYYASIVSGEIRRIRFTGDTSAPEVPANTDPDPETDTETGIETGTGTGTGTGTVTETSAETEASTAPGTSSAVSVGGSLSYWSAIVVFCLAMLRRYGNLSRVSSVRLRGKKKIARAALMPIAALFFLTACSDGVQLDSSSTVATDNNENGLGVEQQEQPEQPEQPTTVVQRLAVHNDGFEGDFYSGSGQCSQCHNGMTDSQGNDVSIVRDWSTSMMANAARDPYWIAKVAVEMKRNPQLTDELNDTCSRCHTPMANDTARKNNLPLTILGDDGFLDEQNTLFDHAMEGVSCTLCHQVEDDGLLGTVEGVSGNYSIAVQARRSDRPAYGPYVDPVGIRMQTQVQFNPLFGSHIATSESCAACHDLRTPEFSNENGVAAASFFPEQMVYSEWRNSAFAQAGPDGRNCQSCHMPTVPGTVSLAVDGGGAPREDFSQHTFLGPNTVMQSVLMNNADDLGITVPGAEFESAIARNREFVKTSASVQILSSERQGNELITRVRVQNLAGHKLPSGFASRRAVVHFTVSNDAGEIVFESGAENADGSITGLASDADSTQYELHYEEITSADQVQVYEAIMGDEASQVTHTLMNASQYLKDNRLLPAGFDKTSAADDIATRGLASADASFDAGGDEIVYRVPVSGVGELDVNVSLVYQPLAFGHLQDLFLEADLPSVGYFQSLYRSATLKSELVASDTVQIIAN